VGSSARVKDARVFVGLHPLHQLRAFTRTTFHYAFLEDCGGGNRA